MTWKFKEKLCGSVPQSRELIRPWLEARAPKVKPVDAIPLDELEEEVANSIQETEERVTLGFQHDESGLYVRAGTIRAHIKDCSNQIKDLVGIKALRSKVANRVYIEPYKVYLYRGDEIVKEEDGEEERPVHAITSKGPITALKRIRYVEKPVLRFRLLLLENKEVTEEVLRAIFEYGAIHGYGGERGMGEGQYEYKIAPKGGLEEE